MSHSLTQKAMLSRTTSLTLLICLLLSFFNISSSLATQSGELKGVTNEISRQQQALTQQQKELNKLQQSLKQQEQSISTSEQEIQKTKQQLAIANKNLDALREKTHQLNSQKKQQEHELKQLLKTYYMINQTQNTLDFFNHNQVEDDRISQYFQYLAKARTDVIAKLEQTHQQLNDNANQLKSEQNSIQSMLNQQTQKRASLTQSQAERQKTINGIQKSIAGDKNYLAELQRNETRLKSEIAKAAKRNTISMDGIANQKGKLPWPLKGKVLHHFGSNQSGQINWKGIVISASYGQPVKAVHAGTVVFAEYLRGYGLVVLLDHGKGDMTLYGYNQSLLKKEGDKVNAGETIALAGDTGGQTSPTLYFEIRRNSIAQNPRVWLQ